MIEPRIKDMRARILDTIGESGALANVVGAMIAARRETVAISHTLWVGGERVRLHIRVEREEPRRIAPVTGEPGNPPQDGKWVWCPRVSDLATPVDMPDPEGQE